MKGGKLIIGDEHRNAARILARCLLPSVEASSGRFVVCISGESGSGKSVLAVALSEALAAHGICSTILQQDDYFVLPPKTSVRVRAMNGHVIGMSEVRLDLLDQDLQTAKAGDDNLTKPLVLFEEDQITSETILLSGIKVLIVEGTYAAALKNVDCRVFIDRDFRDTREARKMRAREAQDRALEGILEIEHGIVASHKEFADLIVTCDYDVMERVDEGGVSAEEDLHSGPPRLFRLCSPAG